MPAATRAAAAPIVPANAPIKNRNSTSCQTACAIPITPIRIPAPINARRNIGFRPNRSAKDPQIGAVSVSESPVALAVSPV
ncbi:MAG: hypothetical protein KJ048_15210 [Dehalococcoidia bacterium]|nr:hypothetical protein [Dehalococcoidia bacterium]